MAEWKDILEGARNGRTLRDVAKDANVAASTVMRLEAQPSEGVKVLARMAKALKLSQAKRLRLLELAAEEEG